MPGWITKSLPRYLLVACTGGHAFVCNLSGLDEKKRVENRKPTPAFSVPEQTAGMRYVYFAALGDQGMGGVNQRHVANLMNEKSRTDSMHFVLTLGDNFYSKGVTSVNDLQWQIKFEEMYDLPHLDVPFYATLGNHDHHNGNGRHQVEYSKKSNKWKMPYYYYTFSRPIDGNSSIQFFALDTDAIALGRNGYLEQVEWLDRELQMSTATWKIVYGHHPVFSYGRHGNENRMIDLVRPLLEKYDVDVYLCGHDHDRQLLEPVAGVHYIVCGTGSKSRDTRYGETTIFAETNLGFAWFRISASDFHMQFIDGEGGVEFAYTWTKGSVPKRPFEAFDSVGLFTN